MRPAVQAFSAFPEEEDVPSIAPPTLHDRLIVRLRAMWEDLKLGRIR